MFCLCLFKPCFKGYVYLKFNTLLNFYICMDIWPKGISHDIQIYFLSVSYALHNILMGFTHENIIFCLFNKSKSKRGTILQNTSFQKCLHPKILTFKPSALIWPRSIRCRLATRKNNTRGFYKSRLICANLNL